MIKIGEFLGKGTYGKVYKIEGRDLAMKQIDLNKTGIRELRELNLLRVINHPNILHLESFVIGDTYLGMILPLATNDLKAEAIGGNKVEKWMYQLLSAIHFLHKNSYFHCDIKPANILLINGNAILSDLGLTGNITKIGQCQSIASPQLMESRGIILKNPIAKEKSNEYQDDIWALGVTFYYMLTGSSRIFLIADLLDRYISSDQEEFFRGIVDPKYVVLLTRLLKPNPKERSLNLLELLALPIFSQYSDYIEGEIISVKNNKPVIFNEDVIEIFKESIYILRTAYRLNENVDSTIKLPIIILFNSIDMYYRIYETFKDRASLLCCLYISAKIYGLDFPEDMILRVPSIDIIKAEVEIVKLLDGYLSRDSVMYYIDQSQYDTFLDWIGANPERYEQCSLAKLAEITRSL